MLLVALVASFARSCYRFFALNEGGKVFLEPVGILIAVMLSTVIGFIFEYNANKRFELLNQVSDDDAVKVIRDGNVS